MVIFCTPRCGSEVATALLQEYQYRKHDMQQIHDTELLNNQDRARTEDMFEECRSMHDAGFMPVIKLVMPGTPMMCVKFFVDNGYDFVFVERKNHRDQVLSQAVGRKFGYHFLNANDIPSPPTNPMEYAYINDDDIINFKRDVDVYENVKNLLARTPTIYFEDFISDYSNLFTALGLDDYEAYITDYNFIKTNKVYGPTKAQFIGNYDQSDELFEKHSIREDLNTLHNE